jgi:diguanylate cyclase (GGDEF)-like protein
MHKNILKSVDFMQHVFDAVPSMLFIVDKDFRIEHLNTAASCMANVIGADVHQRSVGDVLNCAHADQSPQGCGHAPACQYCVIRNIAAAAQDGSTVHREYAEMEFTAGSGTIVLHLMATASPLTGKGAGFVLLVLEDISMLTRAEKEVQGLNTLLVRQATIDTLTGIFNRYHFNEIFVRSIREVQRYNHPLSLIMFDIDNLKKINDERGHAGGDLVLQELAGLLGRNIRDIDIFARWGGEEFMILCLHNKIENARPLALKLRDLIAEHQFDNGLKITCSFGIAQYINGETVESFADRAAGAMDRAKRSGRNGIEVADYEIAEPLS